MDARRPPAINGAFDDIIPSARDAGVIVIASGVDDLEGAAGNARQAFVGQCLIGAGHSLARAQSAHFPAKGQIQVLAGFDLVPAVLDEMKAGYSQGQVDRPPFMLGVMPVMMVYMTKRAGLAPVDINTGKAQI